mmetsp:Transcript_83431/g.232694  ORF Transcript_83431/g.232694 Transcript_83431/m.232694 type:complete len:232 (-) Transcript_83431:70-765(-)
MAVPGGTGEVPKDASRTAAGGLGRCRRDLWRALVAWAPVALPAQTWATRRRGGRVGPKAKDTRFGPARWRRRRLPKNEHPLGGGGTGAIATAAFLAAACPGVFHAASARGSGHTCVCNAAEPRRAGCPSRRARSAWPRAEQRARGGPLSDGGGRRFWRGLLPPWRAPDLLPEDEDARTGPPRREVAFGTAGRRSYRGLGFGQPKAEDAGQPGGGRCIHTMLRAEAMSRRER